MTDLDRQIRALLLGTLIGTHPEPVLESTLKGILRTSFRHVAFTDETLRSHLLLTAHVGLVHQIDDPALGEMWALTPAGHASARSLFPTQPAAALRMKA